MKTTTKLTIEIKGDDIAAVKSVMEKISSETKKPGFVNSFTQAEIDAIKKLNDVLK